MSNGKPTIKVSRDYELESPENERGFLIPVSEWEFLKEKIKKMRSSEKLFFFLANIFLGASASNAFLIKFTQIEQTLRRDILIGFIFTLGIGLVCLLFHFLRGQDVRQSKNGILGDMDHIEKIYRKSD